LAFSWDQETSIGYDACIVARQYSASGIVSLAAATAAGMTTSASYQPMPSGMVVFIKED
jgi:hypothetical protein